MTGNIGDDMIDDALINKKNWRFRPEYRPDGKAQNVMHITRWLTLSAALLVCSCLFSGPASAADSDIASRVRTIVSGIVSYTRWPQQQAMPKLCIFSTSLYSSTLARESRSNDAVPYHPQLVHSSDEALLSECDGIYFGKESPQQQLQLIEKYKSRPLLLIAEQNSQCTIGSSFCMNINSDRVSFSVNLDSLARSGVRVSPDVLLLARTRNNNHE
jgi:hypothetical protein